MTIVSFPTIATAPVTQVFGNYNPALYAGDQRHKGIDYGIVADTPIYACMSGRVTTAETKQTGYGRHIRILHDDGSLSIYGHLNALLVQVGDRVTAGELIGKSGGDPNDKVDGDGLSTGPHLHWEIRPPNMHSTDQTAVDPMDYCLQYLPAVIRYAEVTAALGLNVRAEPHVAAKQLTTAKRRQILPIVEYSNGWVRIHSLRPEWVSEKFLNYTGATIHHTAPTNTANQAPLPIFAENGEGQGRGEITDSEKLTRLWNAHPELHR